MFDGFKYTLWALKQYNLLYGDVLTNAQIEEGVEREIERVNVRYGLTHSFLRVSLQTNKQI